MSSEVEKLVEKAKARCDGGLRLSCIERPGCNGCNEKLDQVLDILRSKPSAGEFTKHLREQVVYVAEMVKGEHSEEELDWPEMFAQIEEACSLLDASREEIERHRWIPVSERLPEEGGCLVLCEGHIYEAKVRVSDDEWEDKDGEPFTMQTAHCNIPHLGGLLIGHDECITHWKPIILPEQALKETP